MLSSPIKINSESFKNYGNEEEIARYIHNLCLNIGIDSELYSPMDIPNFEEHSDYMPGRGLENRYNVSAVWKGTEDKKELLDASILSVDNYKVLIDVLKSAVNVC